MNPFHVPVVLVPLGVLLVPVPASLAVNGTNVQLNEAVPTLGVHVIVCALPVYVLFAGALHVHVTAFCVNVNVYVAVADLWLAVALAVTVAFTVVPTLNVFNLSNVTVLLLIDDPAVLLSSVTLNVAPLW